MYKNLHRHHSTLRVQLEHALAVVVPVFLLLLITGCGEILANGRLAAHAAAAAFSALTQRAGKGRWGHEREGVTTSPGSAMHGRVTCM